MRNGETSPWECRMGDSRGTLCAASPLSLHMIYRDSPVRATRRRWELPDGKILEWDYQDGRVEM